MATVRPVVSRHQPGLASVSRVILSYTDIPSLSRLGFHTDNMIWSVTCRAEAEPRQPSDCYDVTEGAGLDPRPLSSQIWWGAVSPALSGELQSHHTTTPHPQHTSSPSSPSWHHHQPPPPPPTSVSPPASAAALQPLRMSDNRVGLFQPKVKKRNEEGKLFLLGRTLGLSGANFVLLFCLLRLSSA